VHGSKDRVKDASPFLDVGYNFLCLRGCIRLVAYADDVPLLGALRTSAVTGAFRHGRIPVTDTDRPRPSFRRRPAKSAAFQKTGMPSTVTTREGVCRGEIAPSGLRAGSLAHAAHTFSTYWGKVFLMGIARSRCGHPRIRERLESTDAF